MFELKPISSAGVPRAIAKAERYRLLNEPEEAESICLDILQVDADNQEVLVMLLLAITDQFGKHPDVGAGHANRVLAQLRRGAHPSLASGFFHAAMDGYAKAMASSPAGNDDAILRWNACIRFMERNPYFKSETGEEASESGFPDGAPAG